MCGGEYLCTRLIINDMSHKENIIPASSVQMYQVHGNHIDAVMDTQPFFQSYFKRVLSESKLQEKALSTVVMGKPEPFETAVFSLLYGDKDLGFYSIIAVDQENKVNQFMSSFPFYLAKKMQVLVEKVWVWDNLLEATVECSYRDFTFCFFAADYYAHKEDYVPGQVIEIRMGAMGMRVEEPEHGFSFEGQKAVDWLAKLGKEPDYDENGQVKPIHFSTEQLVAFFPGYDKCPDEASFQSQAGEMKERRFMDIDFYETEIIIHRDEFEVSMPFIFRKDFVPDAHKDMPLRGSLWIVGAF